VFSKLQIPNIKYIKSKFKTKILFDMKKVILSALILTLLGFSGNLAAQDKKVVATASAAQIKFEKVVHNFGNIPQGIPATVEFTFKNTGKAPLIVSAVNASCGCTTPSYTKEPVMPGKIGSIKAQYNAGAVGEFNKSITVISNSPEPVILTIQGTVLVASNNTNPNTTSPVNTNK
jgi:hypothetical protein